MLGKTIILYIRAAPNQSMIPKCQATPPKLQGIQAVTPRAKLIKIAFFR
jgi:ribosomal protein L34E